MHEDSLFFSVSSCFTTNIPDDLGAGVLFFITDAAGAPHMCRLQRASDNVIFPFSALKSAIA